MSGIPGNTGNSSETPTRAQQFFDSAVFHLDHGLAFDHGKISAGYEIWRDLKAERAMPSPLDIDPVKLLARAPDWVVENRQPVRVVGTAEFAEKEYLLSESVDLPLSLDGDRVDRILIVAVYRFGRLERDRDA